MIDSHTGERPLPAKIDVSEVETRRFGLTIGRLALAVGTPASGQQVRDLVLRSDLDLAVVRYPSERVDLAASLQGEPLVVWQADTLVYYGLDLRERRSLADRGAVLTEVAGPDDPDLDAVVRAVFDGYGNHYAANPCLSPVKALEGYIEWARTLAASGRGACLLYRDDPAGPVQGVCALQITGDAVDVALAGVHPRWRGRGVYGRMMGALGGWAAACGHQRLEISTQIGNGTVIRTWARQAYRLDLALNTVHLMPRAVFLERCQHGVGSQTGR